MQYRLAPLFCRPWTLMGITPRLIESHYEGNYGSALGAISATPDTRRSKSTTLRNLERLTRLQFRLRWRIMKLS